MTRLLCQIDILLAEIEVSVKQRLAVINQKQADGVIGKYDIGGPVGAAFYLELSATLDVNIFVSFPSVPANPLLNLAPIKDYLLAQRLSCRHRVHRDWRMARTILAA